MSAYRLTMSFNHLLAALIALAVLFAPGVARAGEVFAAVPDHHQQMMQSGHCETTAGDEEHDGDPASMSCCVAMCMAVALTSASAPERVALPRSLNSGTQTSFVVGTAAEIATPPPRAA